MPRLMNSNFPGQKSNDNVSGMNRHHRRGESHGQRSEKNSDQAVKNQGKGDRESAERYNEATHEFVESAKVEEAIEKYQWDSGTAPTTGM